jgi:hypothetical protein
MSAPKCLSEAWESYQADMLPKATPAEIDDARRRFYAGALAYGALLKGWADPASLMSELMAYGRTLGR